jgi:hypothetical protein
MKKRGARWSGAAIASGLFCVFTASTGHAVCGDVSGDGKIQGADALRVLKASVGQTVNLVCDGCPELTVVRGTIGRQVSFIEGDGFTATFIPAGSGGVQVGQAVATNGSNIVFSTDPIPPVDTYLLINGTHSDIYRITEILDASHFKIAGGGYRGGVQASENVTMFRGTTLYPGYEIEFNTPFVGRPSVMLAVDGQSVQGFGQGFFQAGIAVDSSAGGVEAAGTGFHVMLTLSDVPRGNQEPHFPGAAGMNWSFVAIGTK